MVMDHDSITTRDLHYLYNVRTHKKRSAWGYESKATRARFGGMREEGAFVNAERKTSTTIFSAAM